MVYVLPLGGHCCEVVPCHPKERVRRENYMVGMCCHCCEVVPGGFGGPVVRQPWLAGIPQMTQYSMRLLWELMCCGLQPVTPCADQASAPLVVFAFCCWNWCMCHNPLPTKLLGC